VAVSLHHHAGNIDRRRFAELSGKAQSSRPTLPFCDWLPIWMDPSKPVDEELDTLPGLVHHVGDAWDRRQEPNVTLVHYQQLADDTEHAMRTLANRLAIDVAEARWRELVDAASFAAMKKQAAWLAPDRLGVLKSPSAFFRSGRSGEGQGLLGDAELAHYRRRIDDLADPQLTGWLHHPPKMLA
jgi:hypothetical protein